MQGRIVKFRGFRLRRPASQLLAGRRTFWPQPPSKIAFGAAHFKKMGAECGPDFGAAVKYFVISGLNFGFRFRPPFFSVGSPQGCGLASPCVKIRRLFEPIFEPRTFLKAVLCVPSGGNTSPAVMVAKMTFQHCRHRSNQWGGLDLSSLRIRTCGM